MFTLLTSGDPAFIYQILRLQIVLQKGLCQIGYYTLERLFQEEKILSQKWTNWYEII